MTITMTLEEYLDLKARSIPQAELEKRTKEVQKAANDFLRSVGSGPDNHMAALQSFGRAVGSILKVQLQPQPQEQAA